jgi:CelD/BcsL family acetyltransferase involved in cellulose biosynthesis
MSERAAVACVRDPAQVAQFLGDVDRVYNASWQARTYGERRRDTPAEVQRLQALASMGHLRSYILSEEGRAIAFVLGFQYRGRYTYEETGYDLSRSSTSPGSILTYAVIEDLFRADVPHILDFGFGDGAYKRTFGNNAYEVCSVYVVGRGRWRVILGAQQLLNTAYEVIHAGLVRTRLDAFIRRLLKRQR